MTGSRPPPAISVPGCKVLLPEGVAVCGRTTGLEKVFLALKYCSIYFATPVLVQKDWLERVPDADAHPCCRPVSPNEVRAVCTLVYVSPT